MADAGRLRSDADAIRRAALEAVEPAAAVARRLELAGSRLVVDGADLAPPVDVAAAGRIAVVGGGKAAAGLAAGVESLLARAGPAVTARLSGLVSVPEGSGRRLAHVEVRETRPAAANLPTPAVVAATGEMRSLLAALGPRDLAVAVVTGGGSALMCAPRAGVTLAEKAAVARFLAEAGADIRAINTVRQAASDVKAGGLARACGAGRLLVLVISDVTGDPLETIASGPCLDVRVDAGAALAVLDRYGAIAAGIAPGLVRLLADEPRAAVPPGAATASWTTPGGCRVDHVLLADNRTAVDAAAACARGRGYEVTVRQATPGGETDAAAAAVGARLGDEAARLVALTRSDGRPRALIEGGEATVQVPADHGRGGRNQQTVLAARAALGDPASPRAWPAGLLVASIGTDGEDGPTDAAGGCVDAAVAAEIAARALDVGRALDRCDAYPLLAAAGGLVRTGPTGTNVADLRIVLARR